VPPVPFVVKFFSISPVFYNKLSDGIDMIKQQRFSATEVFRISTGMDLHGCRIPILPYTTVFYK
jgi:hypothetical protein